MAIRMIQKIKVHSAMTLINKRSFVGKTIKRMDTRAVNVIRFYFTDGTSAEIEVESLGHGVYGMVQQPVRVDSSAR